MSALRAHKLLSHRQSFVFDPPVVEQYHLAKVKLI